MQFLKELTNESPIELIRARIEYAEKRKAFLLEENFKLSCDIASLNYLLQISFFGEGLLTHEDLYLMSQARVEQLKTDVKENSRDLDQAQKLIVASKIELNQLLEKQERAEKSVTDREMVESEFGMQSKYAMQR